MTEEELRALDRQDALSFEHDCECGFPKGTFACRIRHIQINTGAAKAAND
jgi:hypothetical protein